MNVQIVRAEEMYEWDRRAMDEYGREGYILMENAGRALAGRIREKFPKDEKFLVLIGGGNNGGDGYVIARILKDQGFDVTAVQVVPDEKIEGDALYHKNVYTKSGYDLAELTEQEWNRGTVVIDAMLGIGVKGPLRPPFDDLVRDVNLYGMHRVSIDIPSGLPADEGEEEFEAVKADTTFIVQAPKLSLFTEHTSGYYGEAEVVDIGLPPLSVTDPAREWRAEEDVKEGYPRLPASAHKGSRGKGLLIGGAQMMPGALVMAAKASIRSGAGLTTAATVPGNIPSAAGSLPEVMFMGTEEVDGVISGIDTDSLTGKDAVAAGIGMGRKEPGRAVMETLLKETKVPLLIDADGLYHLRFLLDVLKEREEVTVVTPHVKEMADLTGESTGEVKRNPFSISSKFARDYGVYVVLKGPHTIITAPDGRQIVESSGNEGLAKGGSGDVLTGILLTMLMQHEHPLEALANGCFLHGKSAELLTAGERTVYDLLPTDVVEGLSSVFRTYIKE